MLVNTLTFLIKFFYPLVWLLTTSTNIVCKVLRVKKKEEHAISEAELRKLIIDAKEDGSIKPTEQKMIMKVFNFNDINLDDMYNLFNDIKSKFPDNTVVAIPDYISLQSCSKDVLENIISMIAEIIEEL